MTPERPPTGPQLEGNAYAWGKTARTVTEDHFFSVHRTNPDFVAVDLCSAYPFYSKIMRGQLRAKAHKVSRGHVGQLLDRAFHKRAKLVGRFSSLQGISDETILNLREELEEHEDAGRYLLRAPVFELLTTPPPELVGDRSDERTAQIKEYVKQRLYGSSTVYTSIREAPREHAVEGWHFVLDHNIGSTFSGLMTQILGEETSSAFIDQFSQQLAERLSGSLRTFSMISLDIANFISIRREAKKSFPTGLRHTFFYKSVREPGFHVQADVQQLPFPPESVSFFSCIEGWPFYLGNLGEAVQLSIADQIAQGLQPGGRGVFFPWRFQGQTVQHRELLKKVEAFWKNLGMGVYHDPYKVSDLTSEMSDREYMLVDRSPVFAERVKNLTALVIEKPAA